jgi:hypothetical protein
MLAEQAGPLMKRLFCVEVSGVWCLESGCGWEVACLGANGQPQECIHRAAYIAKQVGQAGLIDKSAPDCEFSAAESSEWRAVFTSESHANLTFKHLGYRTWAVLARPKSEVVESAELARLAAFIRWIYANTPLRFSVMFPSIHP